MRFLISFCLACCLFLSFEAHAKNPMVKLTTNMGDIVIELYPDKAPITVANFEQYVKDGFYDGLIFHRVVKDFVIQGGGFDPKYKRKTTRAQIQNEADNGLKNDKYTISMARTNEPHSASSQFYINVKDNNILNHTAPTVRGWGYAVFGKVIEGFDVVDNISNVRTGFGGFQAEAPVDPVIITKAEIIE